MSRVGPGPHRGPYFGDVDGDPVGGRTGTKVQADYPYGATTRAGGAAHGPRSVSPGGQEPQPGRLAHHDGAGGAGMTESDASRILDAIAKVGDQVTALRGEIASLDGKVTRMLVALDRLEDPDRGVFDAGEMGSEGTIH